MQDPVGDSDSGRRWLLFLFLGLLLGGAVYFTVFPNAKDTVLSVLSLKGQDDFSRCPTASELCNGTAASSTSTSFGNESQRQCPQCIKEGVRCGYAQRSNTAGVLQSNSTEFYGSCCSDLACIGGICRRNQCVEDNQRCGYGSSPATSTQTTQTPTQTPTASAAQPATTAPPTTTTSPASQNTNPPVYFGDCCSGHECVDGYCQPPDHECIQASDPCGFGEMPITAVTANSNIRGKCCGDLACVDGTCAQSQCSDRGELCDYGPGGFFTNNENPTYYGECCGNYQCLNGYCTPPAQNCVQTGSTCGYGTQVTSAVAALPPSATYYGTCCQGDYCYNGVCIPFTGCSKQGQTCIEGQLDCCEGYSCVNGRCVVPCVKPGSQCVYNTDCCEGYCLDGVCSTQCTNVAGDSCWSGGKECCEGLICSNNKCVSPCRKTGGVCSKDRDCCGDLLCVNATCSDCLTAGDLCAESADCCSGYECTNGECVAQQEPCRTSGHCESTVDCCSGYYCNNYYCVRDGTQCHYNGQDCTNAGDCCSGYDCISGRCTPSQAPCQGYGQRCTVNSNCCSGYVCSRTTGTCVTTN